MLIYEVNLYIDNDAAEEMAVWLKAHIRQMLEFDGFEGATWYFLDPEGGRQRWTTQYQVRSWQHLQAYFDTHAEAMRQDGEDRFGGRFSAGRRVLYERERFDR
jgi:hypothetical protein